MPLSGSSLLKKLAKNPGEDSYDNLISAEEAVAEDVLVVATRTGDGEAAAMSVLESLEGRIQAVQDAARNLAGDEALVIFDSHGELSGLYEPGDVLISGNGPTLDSDGRQNFWNLFLEVEEGEGRNQSITGIANALFGKAVGAVSDSFSRSETAMQFAAIVKGFFDYGEATGDTAVLNNSTLLTFIMEGPTAALSGVGSKGSAETLTAYTGTPADNRGAWNALQNVASNIFSGNFGQNGTLSIRSAVNQSTGNRIFVNGATTGGMGVSSVYQMLLNTVVSGIMAHSQIATVTATVAGEGMPVLSAMTSAATGYVSNGASAGMPVIGNGVGATSEANGISDMVGQTTYGADNSIADRGMPTVSAKTSSQAESGIEDRGMPNMVAKASSGVESSVADRGTPIVNQVADSNDRGMPEALGVAAKAASGLTGLGF